MIVNIRGTSGSGKSTIVVRLMEKFGSVPDLADDSVAWPKEKKSRIIGYSLEKTDGYVVGPYTTPTGGCDKIPTQDLVCDLVRRAAKMHKHVIFEGLIISHNYARYRDLAIELGDYRFVFLDTHINVCLDRIRKRRLASDFQRKGPLNEKNTRDKYRDNRRVLRKLMEDGMDVYYMDGMKATRQVLKWFES